MRIGNDGAIRVVGARLSVQADADGLLFFDINEAEGLGARRDNSGKLQLRIQKAPGK